MMAMAEEVQTHTHDYAVTVLQEATCVQEGIYRYTCECGDTYEETEYPGICSMYLFGLATDNYFSYSAYDQLGKFIIV